MTMSEKIRGAFGKLVGRRVVSAGDRMFSDKLFWAKLRFRSERAQYYFDLAKRIDATPGEPISNHFAKDATRRAGEPLGRLAAHWLARWEGLHGEAQQVRLSEIFRGTVPDEDIPILAVAEQGGDIREGLYALSENLIALEDAKTGIASTLFSVGMTLVILHAYLALIAFLVAPELDKAFAVNLRVENYGPLASAYHYGSAFIRHWGWAVLLTEVGIVYWIVRALTRYTGRYRAWLDRRVIVFDFFRRFHGAQFLAGMASSTRKFGTDARNLTQALELIRSTAYPYLAYHIDRMLLNLEYSPNDGGKVFDTGLFDKATSFRIQDVAEYESNLSKMLESVSKEMLKSTPREMQVKAGRFNRRASILLVGLMVALAYMPAFMIDEVKTNARIQKMSGYMGAPSTPAIHP
ncbi:pilus assembly protein TadE [Cupriavidus basilensis]|uniref:pilus assembly protein TadE n=1 Tax=Cupriavidus basilensis TaxID=68895 RepID=UPI000B04A740|nr:pilus assembly protein TadE [Cupriavidus basilensis]